MHFPGRLLPVSDLAVATARLTTRSARTIAIVSAALVLLTRAAAAGPRDAVAFVHEHVPEAASAAARFVEEERSIGGRRVASLSPRYADPIATDGLLRIGYPRVYGDPFVLASSRQRIAFQAVGTSASNARIDSGMLVYEGAWDRVDAIEVPSGLRSEEFLFLRERGAPLVYEYAILEMEGVTDVILRDGAVRFVCDRKAQRTADGTLIDLAGELAIRAPWVIDAAGRRSDSAAKWELIRSNTHPKLRLVLDDRELSYPILIDPDFFLGGAMYVARAQHTATLLSDGRVMLAGGVSTTGGVPLDSAELISPDGADSSAIHSMMVGRVDHTATLLRNGKVLIAGGTLANGSVTNLAELFDPVLNTFSGTDSMNATRRKHTATLLSNGKVLLVGGDSGSNLAMYSAELYDPATNEFTAVGSMETARFNHTATLLPNGRVLVAAGSTAQYMVTNTAELYVPDTATFQATGALNARTGHSATLLPNGFVLIVGGVIHSPMPDLIQPFSQRYDPSSGTFDTNVPVSYFYHPTATLLPNGKVFAAGSGGSSASYQLYDPASNSWAAEVFLPENVRDQTAVLVASGNVFLSGGRVGTTAVNSTRVYIPRGTTGSLTGAESMAVARSTHTATLLPNRNVLIAGGTWTNEPAELFLFASKDMQQTGVMTTTRRMHTATLLPTGKVLLAGGLTGSSTELLTAELYDPASGTFAATGSMSVPRWSHRASLLADGRVLIVGGNSTRSAELYDPATGLFTQTVSPAFPARFALSTTLMRTGVVLIAGGTGSTSATVEGFKHWTGDFEQGTAMQVERGDHTATLLPDGTVYIVGGGTIGVPTAQTETFSSIFDGAAAVNAFPRLAHTATALPDGSVVIIGGVDGSSALSRVDIYQHLSADFGGVTDMAVARWRHTATALADGTVLVTGGETVSGPTNLVEIYDHATGIAEARRPSMSSITPVVCQPASITIAGTNLTGDSEGSSGSTNSSPGNFPMLRLQRVDNDDIRQVGAASFSSTAATSRSIDSFPFGHYRAAVVVNGIPSLESIVHLTSNAPPVLGTYGTTSAPHATSTVVVPAGAPVFPATFQSLSATASPGFTGSLSIHRVSGAVTITNARPIGSFTITVSAATACTTSTKMFTLNVQPVGTPANLIASAASMSSVNLSWLAVPGAASYRIFRSSLNGPFAQVGTTATNGYVDPGLTGGRTYLYRVQAVDGAGLASAVSNTDLATTIVFTDDPLAERITIKQVHIVQARSAANAVRAAAGLTEFAFTDPALTAIAVKAIHVQQLRTAVDQARTALGLPVTSKTWPATAGTLVRALDLVQVRAGVK